MDGGFDPGDHLPSQSAEARLPVNTNDSFVPVTIHQLDQISGDSETIIDGLPRRTLSILGIILDVAEDGTGFIYTIDDGTGVTTIADLLASETSVALPVHSYVHVVGRLGPRSDPTSARISAYSVRPVEDPNQIPYHFLQALYVHLVAVRGHHPPGSAFILTDQAQIAPQGSPNPIQATARESRQEQLHRAILSYLRTMNQAVGASASEIATNLSITWPVAEVETALDELTFTSCIYQSDYDRYLELV
jgi:hypothetical protein